MKLHLTSEEGHLHNWVFYLGSFGDEVVLSGQLSGQPPKILLQVYYYVILDDR